jgi:hypothetical protein
MSVLSNLLYGGVLLLLRLELLAGLYAGGEICSSLAPFLSYDLVLSHLPAASGRYRKAPGASSAPRSWLVGAE